MVDWLVAVKVVLLVVKRGCRKVLMLEK